jgi:hypothetical protein
MLCRLVSSYRRFEIQLVFTIRNSVMPQNIRVFRNTTVENSKTRIQCDCFQDNTAQASLLTVHSNISLSSVAVTELHEINPNANIPSKLQDVDLNWHISRKHERQGKSCE